jgi:hypothetical protein
MKTFKEYLEEARGLEGLKRKIIPGYTKRKIQKKSDKWDKRIDDTHKTAQARSKRAGKDDWTVQDYKDLDKANRAGHRYDRVLAGHKPFSKPYHSPPSKEQQKVKNI